MIKTKKFRDYDDMSNKKIEVKVHIHLGYQTLANKLKRGSAQIKAHFSILS